MDQSRSVGETETPCSEIMRRQRSHDMLLHVGPAVMLFVSLHAHGICGHLTHPVAFSMATGSMLAWPSLRSGVSCRQGGISGVGRIARRVPRVPMMVAGDEGRESREASQNRMQSEFERVAAELDKLGQLSSLEMQAGAEDRDLRAAEGSGRAERVAGEGTTISGGGEPYSDSIGSSAVVTGDGRLFTWGSVCAQPDGGNGSLSPAEVRCDFYCRVRAVACGYDHSACVTEDGRVFAWGSGSRGQLGLGTLGMELAPVEVAGALAGRRAAVVSCGRCHTAVVTADGTLFTFGQGDDGQLGHGAEQDAVEPVEVGGLLAGQRVVQVACGAEVTACVTAEGALYTWGSGIFGQLGHGETDGKAWPTRVRALSEVRVEGVACGIFHMLALDDKGAVYSWGDGCSGQLGHGDCGDQRLPLRVGGPLVGRHVTRVAAGPDHSACVTADGKLFTWGESKGGKLGHGAGEKSDCVQPREVRGLLAGEAVVDVACAAQHTLCVTADGKVFAWGKGGGGQLGHGHTGDRAEPSLVSGVTASARVQASGQAQPRAPASAPASAPPGAAPLPPPSARIAQDAGDRGGGGGAAARGSAGQGGGGASSEGLEGGGGGGERKDTRAEAYRLVDGVIEAGRTAEDGNGAEEERGGKVGGVLREHEEHWVAMRPDDASFPSALSYLLHRMNVRRDLAPVLDTDQLRQLAYALFRFRNKVDQPDAQDLKWFAEQTGLGGSSTERWRSNNRSKWNK